MRLLAAVAAVVAAALLLKLLPALAVLALFVAGLALVTRALKQRSEQEAVAGRAALLGLRPEAGDPGFELRTLPFTLFARVPDGRIDDAMSGTWRGVEVRIFGYLFTSDLPGGTQVQRAVSCAVAPISASVPAVVVEPRSFVATLVEPPALERVDVASGRFAEVFDVRTAAPDFATSLVDEGMRRWLLGTGEVWGFEVRDRVALAYGPGADRADPTPVLDALVGFLDRLPETVRSSRAVEGSAIPPAPDPGADGRV